ncbi:MAG TPA: FHA domain-containing protein [Gemmatimonadales bacterium]|nr:FHA domain-containing protein [Gemmatimonadales bacterium]
MNSCPYCGRANDDAAAFCMDCGKPLTKAAAQARARSSAAAAMSPPAPASPSGPATPLPHPSKGPLPSTRVSAAVAPEAAATAAPAAPVQTGCPFCGKAIAGVLPFCPHCGRRLTAPGSGPACARCGSPVSPGAGFCATCGAPVSSTPALQRPSTQPAVRTDFSFFLVLLDESGKPVQRYERRALDTGIGRQDGDVRFPDDQFMSPLHARITWEQDQLMLRDLGSRNGTWVFFDQPHKLVDGDLLLIGSQMIRFRRLGYPGPHPPDADATKRMGSLIPSADIASLTQLRSDGSARDVVQLSPGRDVRIGREQGDWVFPYDPSMSSKHAVVRSEDADFVVIDDGSRNGIARAARGAVPLTNGSRVLVGDKLLRVELP